MTKASHPKTGRPKAGDDAHKIALDYLAKDLTSLDEEERHVLQGLAEHRVTSRDAMDMASRIIRAAGVTVVDEHVGTTAGSITGGPQRGAERHPDEDDVLPERHFQQRAHVHAA